MGRRWFSSVRRVFSSKEDNKGEKSNKKWGLGKSKEDSKPVIAVLGTPALLLPPSSTKQIIAETGNGENQQAYSVAIATAVAAEAAAAAAHAAVEIVRLTASLRSVGGRSREEIAAMKIQTAFRDYLARRGSRPSRGITRLKSLTNSNAVKFQTMNSLPNWTQTLAMVQSQVRARRIRLSEENKVLHRQLELKREKELEKLKLGEDWNDSPQSKEQMEAKLQKRHEAALRREKTLGYAYSHQWRSNSSRSKNPTYMDPSESQWGWSCLDHWMAARPWDNSRSGKDLSVKSDNWSIAGGITRSHSHQLSCLTSRQLPSARSSIKGKSPSRKSAGSASEDDLQSLLSFQSQQHRRRHSICGALSVRDEESLPSSPRIPGYLSTTESTRAKSRFLTPTAGNSNAKASAQMRSLAVGLVRKQLSFPPAGEIKTVNSSSAHTRRFSGEPKERKLPI